MAYVIPTTFTAVDLFSGPVGRMQKSLLGLTTIAGVRGGAMTNSLNDISNRSMNVATNAAMMGAAIVAPLGLATHAAVEFEQKLGNVETLIDTTQESLSGIGDGILEMSRKIAKPISDLETGMYQIRSAGIEAGNGINQAFGVEISSGKLAIAGLSTTTEAVNAVTSAMNVFKNEGLNSEQIANSFFKTVQLGKTTMSQLNASFGQNAAIIHEAGVSLLEMNAATAALTVSGISASQAQVELAQSVTALIKPSTNLQTVYDALGYTGENAFKNIVAATGGLVPAMQSINKQARTMGVTMGEDFGNKRALVANIELTGTLNDTYKKYLAIQQNGQDTLTAKFGSQSEKAAAQVQLFWNGVNRLGISFGNVLIPAMNKLMAVFNPIMDGFVWFARTFPNITGFVVGGAAAFGVLSLGIAGTSFAIATLTKATWLWNAAMVAVNGVIDFVWIATTAASEGIGFMTVALSGLEAIAAPILLPLGLIAAAIALIGIKMHDTTLDDIALSHSVKQLDGSFKFVKQSINQATLALGAWNKAKEQHQQNVDDFQKKIYLHQYGAHGTKNTWRQYMPGVDYMDQQFMKNASIDTMDDVKYDPKKYGDTTGVNKPDTSTTMNNSKNRDDDMVALLKTIANNTGNGYGGKRSNGVNTLKTHSA